MSFNSDPVLSLFYGRDKVWPGSHMSGYIEFSAPNWNKVKITVARPDLYKAYMSVGGAEFEEIPYDLDNVPVVEFGGSKGSLRVYGENIGTTIRSIKLIDFTQDDDIASGAPVTVTGNVLSLVYSNVTDDDTRTAYLPSLFSNFKDLEYAGDLILPMTFASGGTCSSMFAYSGIVEPPVLRAKLLSNSCYYQMFYHCEKLEKMPELPATTLYSSCYSRMFQYCTKLKEVQALPAQNLTEKCYYQMFYGCTSLIVAPEIKAITTAASCCQEMFRLCTALTTPPYRLKPMALSGKCYYGMFWECRSLLTMPQLPAINAAEDCYYEMFMNCESLKQAVVDIVNPAKNWAGLMFDGCLKLNSLNVAFKEWHTNTSSWFDYSTLKWVEDVYGTGTFIKPPSLPAEFGVSQIPRGWNVINKTS